MEPPPELLDELVGEILLRLPPDDPALLLRASLVCKPWLRLLTDAAFLRRYRAFHQTPPLLGFLRREKDQVTRFVPTASFRPRDPDRRRCRVLDCRHGRVLLYDRDLLVWDPVTGEEWHIPDAGIPYSDFNARVMCAAADCDHRDCHGGPFFVALVRTTDGTEDEWFTHACVYWSEAGEWSAPTTVGVDFIYFQMLRPVLAGDTLYFIPEHGDVILRYNLRGERDLSAIDGPNPRRTVV